MIPDYKDISCVLRDINPILNISKPKQLLPQSKVKNYPRIADAAASVKGVCIAERCLTGTPTDALLVETPVGTHVNCLLTRDMPVAMYVYRRNFIHRHEYVTRKMTHVR